MDNDRASDLLRKAKPFIDEAARLGFSLNFNDAVDMYSKGIDMLTAAFKCMDITHKRYNDTNILLPHYKQRVEELKDDCNFNVSWKYSPFPKPCQVREVEEGSTGHGYEKIFAQCCNQKLREITIHHAYLINDSQVETLVRFCELVALRAKKLKKIYLITCGKSKKSEPSFKILKESLRERGITFDFEFRWVHDRQIIFDNDWKIYLGIGFDYFESNKKIDYTNKLGAFELNFRKCKPGRIIIMMPKVPYDKNGDAALEKLLLEQAATFKKACDYDETGHWNDALYEYKEGVTILSAISNSIPKDHRRYEQIKERLPVYRIRIEELEKICYDESNHEVRRIEEDSTGHGYDRVFKKCCNAKLTKVVVYESIQTEEQKENFIRFCELVVQLSGKLEKVVLHTDQSSKTLFNKHFKNLRKSLKERDINFGVNYSNDEINSEIQFDNGWTVRSEKGLDYFKPSSQFTLGQFEMNFRKCRGNVIYIIRST